MARVYQLAPQSRHMPVSVFSAIVGASSSPQLGSHLYIIFTRCTCDGEKAFHCDQNVLCGGQSTMN